MNVVFLDLSLERYQALSEGHFLGRFKSRFQVGWKSLFGLFAGISSRSGGLGKTASFGKVILVFCGLDFLR